MSFIEVTVSNICANPLRPQASVETRITQARNAGGGVHFGSEITPQRYKDAWVRIMGDGGFVTLGLSREVPVSLSETMWDAKQTWVQYIHAGLANVSPSRYVTEVQAVLRATGEKVAFLAVHPVSEGYDADKAKAGASWPWRHAMLTLYDAWLKARTAILRARGFSVVIGGDFNDPGVTPDAFGANGIEIAHSGLDHIFVYAAPGLTAQPRTDGIVKAVIPPDSALGMDHPILTAAFSLG